MTLPKQWTRRLGILGVLAVLLGGAWWWLFLELPSASGDFTLDLAEVRRLAGSIPGEAATAIRVERVVQFGFPGSIVRAGDGLGMRPMTVFSYQLVFPSHTAVIDTAMTTAIPGGTFDRPSFDRMSRALAAADLIVVTHEHVDHLAGLLAQPDLKALLRVARLNREQVENSASRGAGPFPAGSLVGYQPLTYERYQAVAPGVVLIRAPGHTPGSQLVYVRRGDGAELLFLGDVAWMWDNVTAERERPRAIALVGKEDRGAVVRQLEVLHRLAQTDPALHQIPGHDPTIVDQLVAQHLLEEKFLP